MTTITAKLTITADQHHHLVTILDLGDMGTIERPQDNFKTAIGYARSIGITKVHMSDYLVNNYPYTCQGLAKEGVRQGIEVI